MSSSPVFETYWRFAAERQDIFFRRLADPVGPWTDDPILASHRFTNAYRVSDRVSQYLIREIQYHPERPDTPEELFFRTVLFKLFNRIETWQALESQLGPLTWSATDLDEVCRVLDEMMAQQKRLYSAAYIMPAPSFGYPRKHANHLALLVQMMEDKLPDRIHQAPTLRAVYEMLAQYRGIGPFLAYQYTIDLNYSNFLCHDEGTFVIAGPGALDGIAKCFSDPVIRDPEEIIYWVCERQDREFAALGLKFQSLFGRPLQPIDCQNLFCEVSKYARIAHPEIPGLSGRTRVKQTYRQNPAPLSPLMFPPRWGIAIDRA